MKQATIWVLEILLWAFLMPGQFVQLFHDLRESALHDRSDDDSVSLRKMSTLERSHDCHSCLTSHPRLSAYLAIDGSATVRSEAEGRVCAITRYGFPSLNQEIPNKRSPPV